MASESTGNTVSCSSCNSKNDVCFKSQGSKDSGLLCSKCRNKFNSENETVFSNETQPLDTNSKNPDSKPEVHVEVVKTYVLPIPKRDIQTICPIDEHTMWAVDEKTSSVLHITLGEDIDVKEVYRNERIFEISYSKCGFLYVTENFKISRIDLKGKVEVFADTSPLTSCGIYAYDSGDIVVGIMENEFDEPPVHKIVKYNKNGEQLSVFEYNIEDTPDFIDAIPQEITVNPVNGDILIVDWNGEVANRIVALKSEGNVHWMYFGQLDEPNDDFCPRGGITCTESGHIIVIDDQMRSKRMLFLRPDKNLVCSKSLSDIGIDKADFIARFSKGLFFIANKGCEIHKLSITGV